MRTLTREADIYLSITSKATRVYGKRGRKPNHIVDESNSAFCLRKCRILWILATSALLWNRSLLQTMHGHSVRRHREHGIASTLADAAAYFALQACCVR